MCLPWDNKCVLSIRIVNHVDPPVRSFDGSLGDQALKDAVDGLRHWMAFR